MVLSSVGAACARSARGTTLDELHLRVYRRGCVLPQEWAGMRYTVDRVDAGLLAR